MFFSFFFFVLFFFQAEDGIRDLVRSRGLGDVYKRQVFTDLDAMLTEFVKSKNAEEARCFVYQGNIVEVWEKLVVKHIHIELGSDQTSCHNICLLYTSDAADERSSVDLGGRRIIKKKNKI